MAHLVFHNLLAVPPDLLFNMEAPPAPIEYAGYIIVDIVSSTSNSTSVQLDYSSHQLGYNSTVSIGSSGLAYFPILPTTTLDINLLNTDLTNLNIAMVTITYYY